MPWTRTAGRRAKLEARAPSVKPSATPPTLGCPMDQPTLICAKEFVRDLTDGQVVDSVFEVRELTRRQKRNGEPVGNLQLADVTGAGEAGV